MKNRLARYKSVIRIVVVFLVILAFSCTGRQKRDLPWFGHERTPESLEKLTPEEEEKLAALFTGSLTESLDSLINVYHDRFRFHGNVLVSYHGMLFYSKALGTADFRENTPLQQDARFQLASVSKQFTAVAVLKLIEQGKLDYGDTVSNIIPRFPYERVTVEQLLNHTGGMPNYMWLLEHKWKKGKKAYNDDIIRLMDEHNTHLYFTPGYRYDYSNTGYAVLAYVVEKVSGQRFADFMTEKIFEPLGMHDTFVYSNALDRNYPERLKGYYRRWRRYNRIKETVHDGIVGDKNVYSTIHDLFKWDQALYDGTLLSKETLERAFTPVKIRGKWEYPYGFGFRIKTVHGKKVVYHTGLWEGFRTNFMRYVEDRNTIIILNHTNINVNNILVKKIENILRRDLKSTPVQLVVNAALSKGYDAGLKKYRHLSRKGQKINVKKILQAAQLLSDMGKPRHSSLLLELYQETVSSMTAQDRYLVE